MLKNLDSGAATARRTSQLLIGIAVIILLVGGGLMFLTFSRISAVKQTAEAKEAEVGSSEQVANRYQSTVDTYNQTLSHIQYLETSVTPKTYMPTLLKQLQSLAAATHLKVTAVRPSPPVTSSSNSGTGDKRSATPYDTEDIAVDVTGTYTNTAAFLYGLTRFPKIISVDSATFNPTPDANQNPAASPRVTTNLKLTAFIFTDDTAADPVPTAPATTVAGVAANAASPGGVVPPPAAPTIAGAAGRATQGALNATHAANSQTNTAIKSL